MWNIAITTCELVLKAKQYKKKYKACVRCSNMVLLLLKPLGFYCGFFMNLHYFLINLLIIECDSFLNYSKNNQISKYRILILYAPLLTLPSMLHTAKSNLIHWKNGFFEKTVYKIKECIN